MHKDLGAVVPRQPQPSHRTSPVAFDAALKARWSRPRAANAAARVVVDPSDRERPALRALILLATSARLERSPPGLLACTAYQSHVRVRRHCSLTVCRRRSVSMAVGSRRSCRAMPRKLTEDRDRRGAGVDVRADAPGRNPGVDVGAQVGPEALVSLAKGSRRARVRSATQPRAAGTPGAADPLRQEQRHSRPSGRVAEPGRVRPGHAFLSRLELIEAMGEVVAFDGVLGQE